MHSCSQYGCCQIWALQCSGRVEKSYVRTSPFALYHLSICWWPQCIHSLIGCVKAQIIWNWFQIYQWVHCTEMTSINRTHLGCVIIDVHQKRLQQLCDVENSEECLQHLVQFHSRRFKETGVQPSYSKVFSECMMDTTFPCHRSHFLF